MPEGKRSDAKFCSALCRRRARAARNSADPEFREQNRDYQREWARQRRRSEGRPEKQKARKAHAEASYASFVDQRGDDECWPWKGSRSKKNYGQFGNGRAGSILAHRYGYETLIRPLEPGETVDHICHNRDQACPAGDACEHRACQNPAHWEAVPGVVNVARGKSFSAVNARKTHCPQGHELTPENVYLVHGGRSRQCKTCTKERAAKQHRDEGYKAQRRQRYDAGRKAGMPPQQARKFRPQPPSPPSAAA